MAARCSDSVTRELPGGVKLRVDLWGRTEVGSVAVDNDFDENSSKLLCETLAIAPGEFVDLQSDGVKLQAIHDECLVQVGNFGIMQNKERVLYGMMEDNEFTSCVAVFDKRSKKWATTVAFQVQFIEENKARQKVASALKEVFQKFQKKPNLKKEMIVKTS